MEATVLNRFGFRQTNPIADRAIHKNATTFNFDQKTEERFVVKLEKDAPVPKPGAKPPVTAVKPPSTGPKSCNRPATCPAESWDPFECRCRGM